MRDYEQMRKGVLVLLLFLLACAPAWSQDTEYAELIKKGMKALEADSLSKAETIFLQAIAVKPADKASAVLYQYVGQLRVRQERHKEALEAFNYALQLAPTSQEVLMDRASLNIQIGRESHALNDLCDLLTMNQEHADALFFRAYIYAEQHLNAKARADYERLVILQPRNREARLGLALLCDKDRRPQEAMEHIDVLLRYWPDDATVYAVRGGMYQKRRNYELALRDMNRAIELEPENPDFYISRALLYKDFHKKALATADFRKAVDLGASAQECASMMLDAE